MAMMVLSAPTNAQSIDHQYSKLSQTEKDGAKTVLLTTISNSIVQHLKNNNGVIALNDTSLLKEVVWPSKKVRLYYTVVEMQNNKRLINYFITHSRDGVQQASSFIEELPDAEPVKHGAPPLKIVPAIKHDTIATDLFYAFELKEGSQRQLISIPDVLLKSMYEEMAQPLNDDEKLSINAIIVKKMRLLWARKETLNVSFQSFNRMSVLTSVDKKMRIYTWNTQLANFNHTFWGAITKQKPDGSISIQELVDKTSDIKTAERANLTPKKWYGAIYYDMIETEYKKQKYYTLIGFKGTTEFTKAKLIDVLSFDGNGDARFGSAILNKGPGYLPRIIYEYSLQANMMLKYDPVHKMIVMDNLMPSSPIYKDIFMHYGPDFSYNGLKFEKGKWIYYPDIDLRNPKTK
jgi:hypothetical protein